MGEAEPKRRKRKKRPKTPKAEASPSPLEASPSSPEPHAEGAPRRRRSWWWIVLGVALFELFLFGRRGELRVCVARDGEHDFALVDQPRNDENTQRYPTCEKRTNLGIVSHYDEARDHAAATACQRATVLRPKDEVYLCALRQAGWAHREESAFVPPWDERYYKRMLWFIFD
ncbi:MAG: hypothetical protein AAGN82_17545 [Myxococcota bacterium]